MLNMEHSNSTFFNFESGNEFFPVETNFASLLGSPWSAAAEGKLLARKSADNLEKFVDVELGEEESSSRIVLGGRTPLLSTESQGRGNSAVNSQTTREALNGDSDAVIQAGTTYTSASSTMITYVSSAVFALADLDGISGFTIEGLDLGDSLGLSVSGAGDINSDGIDDFIIGAPTADPNGRIDAGESYVILGQAGGLGASFDLTSLDGSNGFVLNGTNASGSSGFSVSSAGDINGDGIDDLAIGAIFADSDNGANTGESYVVFGSDTGFVPSLDLSTLDGSDGFAVSGVGELDLFGREISSAGDVNGDGIDDLIIGALFADPDGVTDAGQSYIIFGQTESFTPQFDLTTLDGSNGFAIAGPNTGDLLGDGVSRAGDVNGDGLDDLIVGASGGDPNGIPEAGESYVIFGQEGGFAPELDLTTLDGSNGFVINGLGAFDLSGASVSGAGDINGDGFDDLIIGADLADPDGRTDAGESYVIFGQEGGFGASFDLTSLDGTNGFAILGADAEDNSGISVSIAGDINDDGLDDLIVGAPDASPDGTPSAGKSYVVFGSNQGFGASLDLASLDGNNGFVLEGIYSNGESGFSVSGAGDVNNDGIDDLMVGDYVTDSDFRGESYIVYGNSAPELDLNGAEPGLDFSATFEVGGSPVAVVDNSALTVSDRSGTISEAIITLTNPLDGDAENLKVNSRGTNITADFDNTTSTLTLSGPDTVANYQQVLRTLTYNNKAANPDPTERTISLILDDGAAFDQFSSVATTTVSIVPNFDENTIHGTEGNDVLKGDNGNNMINSFSGDDVLVGDNSDDFLNGGDENDLLVAGAGNDILTGGDGSDHLVGGAGDDVLIGVDPASNYPGFNETDLLTGGAGADTFVLGDQATPYYLGEAGFVVIKDFQSGEDRIQLTGSLEDYTFDANQIFFDSGHSPGLPDAADDLIARVSGSGLTDSDFNFV